MLWLIGDAGREIGRE